jgi:hypothetical protein
MTPERDPEQEERATQKTADRLMRESDDMEARSETLRDGIDEARQDWERKRSDQSVPGANPPESDEGQPEEASYPSKGGDEEGGSTASPANP